MRQAIVVPLIGPRLDADGVSEQALPMVRALAERTDATVALVSVIEVLAELGGLPESTLIKPETLDRHVAEREAYLAGIARTLAPHPVRTFVRVGDPADEILAAVETFERPVVAMTSHAKRGMRRLVLGSVAFDCVRYGSYPVIVVPVQPDFDSEATARIDRLLIPIDGSPLAECVLDEALDALGPPTLDLHLVHVVDPGTGSVVSRGRPQDDITMTLVRDNLEQLTRRLVLDGYRASWEIREGEPEQEIARVAEERGVSLVAMATRGRSGVGRLLLGSVTEDVATLTRLPLLVVKPSPETVASIRRTTRAGKRAFQAAGAAGEHPALMTAADIMVSPIVTMDADTPLADVARAMLEHQIGAIPLVDAAGQLIGIVSESSVISDERWRSPVRSDRLRLFGQSMAQEGIERIYATGRNLTARQVMRQPVVTATEDEPVTSVVARMVTHDVNRIPIVRDGRPVGIVARHDILKLLAGEPHRGAEHDGKEHASAEAQ